MNSFPVNCVLSCVGGFPLLQVYFTCVAAHLCCYSDDLPRGTYTWFYPFRVSAHPALSLVSVLFSALSRHAFLDHFLDLSFELPAAPLVCSFSLSLK